MGDSFSSNDSVLAPFVPVDWEPGVDGIRYVMRDGDGQWTRSIKSPPLWLLARRRLRKKGIVEKVAGGRDCRLSGWPVKQGLVGEVSRPTDGWSQN